MPIHSVFCSYSVSKEYSPFSLFRHIDVPLVISDETLSLDEYRGMGKTGSEVELPEDEAQSQSVIFDEAAMSQLEGMGFPPVRCQKALLATGNADAEAAMNWLFAHMEDPGELTLSQQQYNVADVIQRHRRPDPCRATGERKYSSLKVRWSFNRGYRNGSRYGLFGEPSTESPCRKFRQY